MSEPNENDFGLVADILGNAQKHACAVYVAAYREECERAERERVIAEIEGWIQWYTPEPGVESGLREIIDSVRKKS